VITGPVFAQGKSTDARPRNYGIGQPKDVSELPYGQFRKKIEHLPPQAQGKALGWLRSFSFPVEDIASLRVNAQGDISYADTVLPDQAESVPGDAEYLTAADISLDQAFRLHSRPGSHNILFLDFDGAIVEGRAWSSERLVALPFDPSQNDNPPTAANFTQDELNRIHEIWHRVAEDYAPFDIDVTTEEPAVFTNTTGHILFTHDSDANGLAMPGQGAGGVAYINVFGSSWYPTYSPAFVYYTNLSSGSYGVASYNAEAASHEFGHNIGLAHDGLSGVSEYYEGHGDGLVSWAPIMGKPFYRNVTQWSRGDYPNANNSQDDLVWLQVELGLAGDDHADSYDQATPIEVEANGDILVSDPALDPDNVLTQNKGVIDASDDVDWFYLDISGSGTVSLAATPAWHAFQRIDKRGANLDIDLSIFDRNLVPVDFAEPENETNASVVFPVTTGRFFIQVDGVGNRAASDYSDYASIGMYFLEGKVDLTTDSQPDTSPPTPATMAWDVAPTAIDQFTIEMTAVAATDESGLVEYLFTCVAGAGGCASSSWQANRSYTATGLDPDTYYEFSVKARDQALNENAASISLGDRTAPLPPPPVEVDNEAPVAVASYSPTPAVILQGNSADVRLDGTGSSDSDGTIVSWSWTDANGSVVATGATADISLHEGDYVFTLTVTDDQGATASVEITVSVTQNNDGGGEPQQGHTPPANLVASVSKTGKGKKMVKQATLTWTDNSNGPDNEDLFVIERCEEIGKGKNKTCSFTQRATVGQDVTLFTDESVSGTFKYRVKARRGADDDTAYTNEVKI